MRVFGQISVNKFKLNVAKNTKISWKHVESFGLPQNIFKVLHYSQLYEFHWLKIKSIFWYIISKCFYEIQDRVSFMFKYYTCEIRNCFVCIYLVLKKKTIIWLWNYDYVITYEISYKIRDYNIFDGLTLWLFFVS